jgi:cytochrome c6
LANRSSQLLVIGVTVERKPRMLLFPLPSTKRSFEGSCRRSLGRGQQEAVRVRLRFVAVLTGQPIGSPSAGRLAKRISVSISHKSLCLGRNGMKRMLPGLLLFAFAVSVNCVADSTDSAALFKSKCAMCHGPDGTANTTMAKNLGIKSYKSPDVQKQSDADLKNTIVNGKGKMPSYKSLTPEQVDALVKYIRELGK